MAEKRLSHAYMLVGPEGPAREAAAQELAAALLCREANAPCRRCRDCRKVLAGTHPDMIFVERQPDDRGRLRRELLVGQIRTVTADAYIAPNEAERKVYVIREADRMNTEAQNALLKALEEPPGHASFILCTNAADALLPTVRSRCVRRETDEREAALPALSDLAREYLRLLAGDEPAEMARYCILRGRLEREEADALLEEIERALPDVLTGRRPNQGLTPRRALAAAEWLGRARESLRRNISSKQAFGRLAAEFDLFDLGDTDD